ncbi:MAG: FecR domain-containing protein [Bacteroidetes bacterium]|nr:FecR domain-containing protein [Bacteroidota bacterium]
METNSTYYIDLITRYFYNEATPDEIRELEAWVKADPKNKVTFSEYHKTWKAVENARVESSADIDLEWKTLVPKLTIKEAESRHLILRWSLRIAAIFLLAAIPTFFLYRYFGNESEKQLIVTTGMVEQTLPDGTIVTLNTGAILSYPSRFEGSLRKVTLQGEAWFEVAPDKTKPFIIAAENVRIRVVGTSFFVNTKTPDDETEIILSTGIVRVYYSDMPRKTALLDPGDKAVLAGNGHEVIKTTNEDVNFLAWKTKHMVFNNTSLIEVVELLSKVYHTNIRLSGSLLNDCRITTTFDRQSLESVLNVLKATLDLQIRNTGAGIEITGHGCYQNK